MNGISGMYPNATIQGAAGVAIDYLDETDGFKNELLKVGAYGLKWIRMANDGQLSAPASKTLSTLEGAKNLVGIPEFLEHLKKFAEYAFSWITGADQTTAEKKAGITQDTRITEAAFQVVDMVNPAKDVISFGKDHGLVALDPLMQTIVDGAGSAALILGPGRGAYNAIVGIGEASQKAADPSKSVEEKTVANATIVKNLLNLVKLTSYVALGFILGGMLVANSLFAAGIVLNPVIPLALVTNALIFGLASHFHKNLSVLSNVKV